MQIGFIAVKQRLSQRTPTTQPARTDYIHVEPYNVAYTDTPAGRGSAYMGARLPPAERLISIENISVFIYIDIH